MSNLELTAKICSDKVCAVTVGNDPTEHEGPSLLSTEDNGSTLEIEIPLVPLSHVPRNEMFIEAYTQPEGIVYPQLCRADSVSFSWELLGHPLVGVYGDLGAYWIKIIAENLDICNFEGAQIRGEHAGIIKSYVPTSGGVIPTDGSDPLTIETTFDNTNDPQIQGDPMIVPGERISLWWKIGTNGNYQEVAHVFIHTCLLTGGRVMAISGDYGGISITYSVRIEGTIYEGVTSSDFREYTVGEWVYLMKPTEYGALNCGRELGCEGEEYSGGGVIIPIHITGVSP